MQASDLGMPSEEAAILELAVFAELGRGPLDAATLAERLPLDRPRVETLCEALVGEGLLERRGARYRNSAEVRQILEEQTGGKVSRLLALLPLALVLALAFAGYHAWFIPPHQAAAAASQAAATPAAAVTGEQTSEPVDQANIYYLVGSAADAVLTQALFPFSKTLVACSAGEEDAAETRIAQESIARETAHLDPIRIIDLRHCDGGEDGR